MEGPAGDGAGSGSFCVVVPVAVLGCVGATVGACSGPCDEDGAGDDGIAKREVGGKDDDEGEGDGERDDVACLSKLEGTVVAGGGRGDVGTSCGSGRWPFAMSGANF